MEIWKDVIGWEERYEVSNQGKIRNKKTNRLLKQSERPKGYVAITLYAGKRNTRKTYLVHRVVAEAFIGKSELQVNHKDLNKKNNYADNLEYCTNLENMQHAVRNGIYIEDREKRKKPILQIHPITGEVVKKWNSITEAKMAGYSIGDVLYGKSKSAKGYYWRYAQ